MALKTVRTADGAVIKNQCSTLSLASKKAIYKKETSLISLMLSLIMNGEKEKKGLTIYAATIRKREHMLSSGRLFIQHPSKWMATHEFY